MRRVAVAIKYFPDTEQVSGKPSVLKFIHYALYFGTKIGALRIHLIFTINGRDERWGINP